MEQFLTASRKALADLDAYKSVKVVLGNQTCDLDSAVCALVQGLFCHYDLLKRNRVDVIVIPVLNISEREFRVKTEVVYYLKQHNIPFHLLTFRDHIDLRSLQRQNKLELILVDHHALAEEDVTLADSVVEVIDHRPQDRTWPWPGKRVNIQTVGSCATLVGRNLLEKYPEIIDVQVSNLLRGPILIDTYNFSKEANRGTSEDLDVIKRLEKSGAIEVSRDVTFKEILDAKTDISNLRPSDLMIRDLKVTNGVPIVGLPILVENFLKLSGALEAVKTFTKEKSCFITVIMGMDLKKDIKRDIATFSLGNDELECKITQALTTSEQPNLKLTVTKRLSEDGCKLVVYKQENVSATRKQVLPIIQSATLTSLPC